MVVGGPGAGLLARGVAELRHVLEQGAKVLARLGLDLVRPTRVVALRLGLDHQDIADGGRTAFRAGLLVFHRLGVELRCVVGDFADEGHVANGDDLAHGNEVEDLVVVGIRKRD